MAEFCSCGSLVIGGKCTNKNCSLRALEKSTEKKSASTRAKKTDKAATAKTPKTRKASKCVTYNMYEIKEEDTI